jgi:hypothetical protein
MASAEPITSQTTIGWRVDRGMADPTGAGRVFVGLPLPAFTPGDYALHPCLHLRAGRFRASVAVRDRR